MASTQRLSTGPSIEAYIWVKRFTSAVTRQLVVCVALHVGGRRLVGMVTNVPVLMFATGDVSEPASCSLRRKYQYSRRHVPPKSSVCLSSVSVELLTNW